MNTQDQRESDAVARGVETRKKLIEAEGGSISAEAVAEMLNTPRHQVLRIYMEGRLLGFRDEDRDGEVRFPVWQFKDGRVMDGIESVLHELDRYGLDDFGKMAFFLSGCKRPLDWIRDGKPAWAWEAAFHYLYGQ
jgi:hypothetical protein